MWPTSRAKCLPDPQQQDNRYYFLCFLEDVLRSWGQEYPRLKKLDDLMPINVTVTNSRKIVLPESVNFFSIYISSFKIKFQSLPFFSWAVTEDPYCALVRHETPN